MRLKDIVVRRFTTKLETSKYKGKTVWDLFDWKSVKVEVKNYSTGEIIFSLDNAEFPEHFSDRACNIIAGNYFRKNVPFLKEGKETSYRQVVHRMVNFWVSALKDEKVIHTDEDFSILYDELCYMMCAQMFAPNSPQWFNTGLQLSYGITGESRGHFYFDELEGNVVESKDSYTRTQGSACFIIGIQDALLGSKSITDNLTTETRLFKYGSGVGSNFSAIRGEGEKLSGGGKSSGLMSFLNVFDRNAGAIKSGGTTRRAAKMNILNVDHPDIETFVEWKTHEEQKVRDLGKMGYDTNFTGEAYATVSGQNANNSVRLTDEFMQAVENDGDWNLISRTTGEVVKTIKAKALWESIAECAWSCGDPGVQFHDIINNWHTCPINEYGDEEWIQASNPCSEYMFLDDTACNLASLNLMAFLDSKGNLDIGGYIHCINLVHLVLEATIHWGQFPTEDIARRSYLYRTTGMGYANLGGLLMNWAIPYGSEKGSDIGAYLMSLMTATCYKVSALLAKEVGTFEVYESNKEQINKVLERHKSFAVNRVESDKRYIKDTGFCSGVTLEDAWNETCDLVRQHGVRNAQTTVIAPTGTISFAMDCVTTSAEPMFSHIIYKTVVDGSTITMVNPLTENALLKLGYTDDEVSAIKEHVLQTGSFYQAPYMKASDYDVFKVANDAYEELTITPDEHLFMMSKLTQQVSGAISKTVNLPSSATVEDIADVFMKSWKWGIKAITVYRDGSKASQPLNNGSEKKTEDLTYAELLAKVKELETENTELRQHMPEDATLDKSTRQSYQSANFGYMYEDCKPTRHKPRGTREARVHEAVVGDMRVYITVTKIDGKPVEVFTSCGRQGSLVKGLLESMSMLISLSLQYGIPVEDISKLLRGHKYEPRGFVGEHENIKCVDSLSDLLSKVLDIECGDYTFCQVKPVVTDGNHEESHIGKLYHEAMKGFEHLTNPHQELEELVKHIPTYDTLEEAGIADNNDILNKPKVYGMRCSKCGSEDLRQNGTCRVCTVCGTTTGCS